MEENKKTRDYRTYYEKNKQQRIAYQKEYYRQNKDRISTYNRTYYDNYMRPTKKKDSKQ